MGASARGDGHELYNVVSSITDAGVPAYLKSLVNGADAETTWAAVWKNGGVEIIASDEGNRMLSSLTQSLLISDAAKDQVAGVAGKRALACKLVTLASTVSTAMGDPRVLQWQEASKSMNPDEEVTYGTTVQLGVVDH